MAASVSGDSATIKTKRQTVHAKFYVTVLKKVYWLKNIYKYTNWNEQWLKAIKWNSGNIQNIKKTLGGKVFLKGFSLHRPEIKSTV